MPHRISKSREGLREWGGLGWLGMIPKYIASIACDLTTGIMVTSGDILIEIKVAHGNQKSMAKAMANLPDIYRRCRTSPSVNK